MSYRPALTLVSAQTYAVQASAEGLACVDGGREEAALAAVLKVANGVMPTHEDDESPAAWARRGVRDGIEAQWRGRIEYTPAAVEGLDLAMHQAGWMLGFWSCVAVRGAHRG